MSGNNKNGIFNEILTARNEKFRMLHFLNTSKGPTMSKFIIQVLLGWEECSKLFSEIDIPFRILIGDCKGNQILGCELIKVNEENYFKVQIAEE